MRCSLGFSLVELMVVLTILALAATLAAVSLAGPARTVARQDVLDRLVHEDELCRRHAQRHNVTMELLIDLDNQRLQRRIVGEHTAAAAQQTMAPWTLPQGYTVTNLIIQGHGPVQRQAAIHYAPQGRSLSFAIQIASPPDELNQRTRQWLLIAGASGQVVPLDDEEAVDRVFALLDEE